MCQGFIQTVLLMSVFWTKIEFSNVVKCRRGCQGAVSSAADSQRSLNGGSWGKVHERVWSEGQINSFKPKKPSKQMYSEQNFNAKML